MTNISIENIYKAYDSKQVFENFSLKIGLKENTCLLGQSGIGKTTLLKLIAGLESPDKGEIKKDNIKFSYVFQEPALLPWASVYENINYILKTRLNRDVVKDRLKKLSLEDELDSYPFELSGGMKQRIAIARALSYEADLILMDEPFQNLDLKSNEMMIRIYENLMRESGVNFIFVSHNIDQAIRLADRIILLKKEKILRPLIFENKAGFNEVKREIEDKIRDEKIKKYY